MLMIPILDTAPDPGELIRFEVPAPILAAATAAAPLSPVPPSYVQENHVRRLLVNRAAEKRQSPWVAIMFDVPGRLDTTAMAAALTQWARRHPTLLTWFQLDEQADAPAVGSADDSPNDSADGSGQLRRYAVDPAAVSIEPVSLGGYDSPAEIRDWLLELFQTGTDPLKCSQDLPSGNPADTHCGVLVSAVEPGRRRLLHHHPTHAVFIFQTREVL